MRGRRHVPGETGPWVRRGASQPSHRRDFWQHRQTRRHRQRQERARPSRKRRVHPDQVPPERRSRRRKLLPARTLPVPEPRRHPDAHRVPARPARCRRESHGTADPRRAPPGHRGPRRSPATRQARDHHLPAGRQRRQVRHNRVAHLRCRERYQSGRHRARNLRHRGLRPSHLAGRQRQRGAPRGPLPPGSTWAASRGRAAS